MHAVRYIIAHLRNGIIKFRRNAISRIHHMAELITKQTRSVRVLLSRNSQFTAREELIQFIFNISPTHEHAFA